MGRPTLPVHILVGVGQETFRPQSADDFVNPVEAMKGVVERAWAQTPKDDRDVLDAMMTQEWVGKRGTISGTEESVNIVDFS